MENLAKLLTHLKKISRKDLAKIQGGLTNLKKYDPNDPCQNTTEQAPSGCACTSGDSCQPTYRWVKDDIGGHYAYYTGECHNGTCI